MSGSAVKGHDLPKRRRHLNAKTDNFVPLVVPVLSASSGSNSSETSTPHDRAKGRTGPTKVVRINRLRDLPEKLEEFTDDLEDTEVHATRTHFS